MKIQKKKLKLKCFLRCLFLAVYKGQGGQVECCRNDSASDLCFYYKIGSSAENLEKVSSVPYCFKFQVF